MRRGAWVIFWLALLAPAAATVIWLSRDRRASDAFDAFSSLNRSRNGLSIAHDYLKRRRGSVAILRERIDATKIEPNAVVLRIGPMFTPAMWLAPEEEENPRKEKKDKKKKSRKPREVPILTPDEEEWLQRGGRLVLAIDEPYGALGVVTVSGASMTRVFPHLPDLEINPPKPRILEGSPLRHAHAVYLIDGQPAMTRMKVGAGELFAIATPEIFRNSALSSESLRLLEALAPPSRPLYFDEFVHGLLRERGIAWLLIDRWRLGPLLLFLLIAALLAFWRGRSQLGPPERPERESRSEAIDLVAALGQLYEQTLRRDEALHHYYRSFVRAVALQTGLQGDPLQQKVREWTGGWAPKQLPWEISRDDFLNQLSILNNAYRRLEHGKHK